MLFSNTVTPALIPAEHHHTDGYGPVMSDIRASQIHSSYLHDSQTKSWPLNFGLVKVLKDVFYHVSKVQVFNFWLLLNSLLCEWFLVICQPHLLLKVMSCGRQYCLCVRCAFSMTTYTTGCLGWARAEMPGLLIPNYFFHLSALGNLEQGKLCTDRSE